MALYVTDSDPSAGPWDISNYTLLGNRKSTGLSETADPIDFTDADSPAMEFQPGKPSASISGTYNKDFAGDTGMELLRQALRNESPVWWLYSTEVSGDKAHKGKANVSEVSETNPHQGPAEVNANLQVTGAVTSADVS